MLLLVQIRRPSNVSPSTCVQQEKCSNTRQKLTNRETAQSRNRCWNISAFFSSVLFSCWKSFFSSLLSETEKAESAVRQSQLSLLSVSMFFFSLFCFWVLVSSTSVKIKQLSKSAGLVQKLARPADVSVEWAVGQSERCHSSLLSPVWVCIWGTGTTRATAANKGPLSGSACCTQWHQLSPPTSSSKHTMRGRDRYHTHTHNKNTNNSTQNSYQQYETKADLSLDSVKTINSSSSLQWKSWDDYKKLLLQLFKPPSPLSLSCCCSLSPFWPCVFPLSILKCLQVEESVLETGPGC